MVAAVPAAQSARAGLYSCTAPLRAHTVRPELVERRSDSVPGLITPDRSATEAPGSLPTRRGLPRAPPRGLRKARRPALFCQSYCGPARPRSLPRLP